MKARVVVVRVGVPASQMTERERERERERDLTVITVSGRATEGAETVLLWAGEMYRDRRQGGTAEQLL